MKIKWRKCVGDVWCKLNYVRLDHQHFNNMAGVYMIWHGGANPQVVYVGQGDIRDRLRHHRNDQEVQNYKDEDLYVTWAKVEECDRDGVEAYLSEHWQPLVGSRHPKASPIEVNSPWDG